MIKVKIFLSLASVLMLSSPQVIGQNSTMASGASVSSASGSLSYSVGQVAYTYITTTTGSLSEGVQHVFEIFELNVDNIEKDLVQVTVYPNPTNGALNVQIENVGHDDYVVVILDNTGKEVYACSLNKGVKSISIEKLEAGIYFMNIHNNNIPVRVFKIIKN